MKKVRRHESGPDGTRRPARTKAMQTDAWKDDVTKSGLTQDYADGLTFQKEVSEAYDLIGKALAK